MSEMGQDQKRTIVAGVAASAVFVYFLQPILDRVAGLVVSVLTILNSAYIDKIFSQAAHVRTQDYAFLWLAVVFGVTAGVVFSVGSIILVGESRFRYFMKKRAARPSKEPGLFARIATGIFFIGVALGFLVVFAANYTQLRVITSFEQHMHIISPYLSEHEEEIIYSRWALMDSKADYIAIYRSIGAIAHENKVPLPRNKIYSPTSL